MKIVIAISSAGPYKARREICRVGWLRQLPHPDVEVFFGIGAFSDYYWEDKKMAPVEVLPVPDDYRSLCLKTQAMVHLAIDPTRYQGDWVFKCDDDTFVHVERLVKRANEAQERGENYVGSTRGQRFCEGGAGYLLSQWAATSIDIAEAPAIGMEDIWVGSVLASEGIVPTDDPRFVQRGNVHPAPDNDQITSHLIRSHTTARMIQKPFDPPKKEANEKEATGK